MERGPEVGMIIHFVGPWHDLTGTVVLTYPENFGARIRDANGDYWCVGDLPMGNYEHGWEFIGWADPVDRLELLMEV